MFFPIDAEEWSQALGRIRRLRHSRNWSRIGSSELYWNAPFLAVLIDTIDGLLIEDPRLALELSRQAILLAERIRPEDCPGSSELGKRSLGAWAHAVHGSSCRALERYPDAEASFQTALALTGRKVLHWAAAEVWRRYAALLLFQQSPAGLDFVNKAVDYYAGFPVGQADALILRGLFRQYLANDLTGAALDTGRALELLDAKRSPREARSWAIAVDNLGIIYASGTTDLEAIEATLKRLRHAAAKLSRHEPFRRMTCMWVQALLLAPLGVGRKAARLLVKASDWLLHNGHYKAAAICSADLARILFRSGDENAAIAVLDDLPDATGEAEPRFQAYLAEQLANWRAKKLGEESLAALREALALYDRNPLKADQPLGTSDGRSSSPGPPKAALDSPLSS